jgi:hypothetical protein
MGAPHVEFPDDAAGEDTIVYGNPSTAQVAGPHLDFEATTTAVAALTLVR